MIDAIYTHFISAFCVYLNMRISPQFFFSALISLPAFSGN